MKNDTQERNPQRVWKFWLGFGGMILIVVFLSFRGDEEIYSFIPGACISEMRVQVTNVAGGYFEIIDTNCDTLAKEEWISVYVMSRSWINRLLFGRRLLFRYDPGVWDDPLPTIMTSGSKRLLISVPQVSSINLQRKNWGGVSVDYKNGKIIYTEPVASHDTH